MGQVVPLQTRLSSVYAYRRGDNTGGARRQAKELRGGLWVIHKVSREVRHRDAILLQLTRQRVRPKCGGPGAHLAIVPRACTFEELRKRVAADVGETRRRSRRAATATTFGRAQRLAGRRRRPSASSCSRRGRASWTRPGFLMRRLPKDVPRKLRLGVKVYVYVKKSRGVFATYAPNASSR